MAVNTYADAIKRIVEPLLPKRTGDDPNADKEPIPGQRGYGLGNGKAGSGGAGASTPANDEKESKYFSDKAKEVAGKTAGSISGSMFDLMSAGSLGAVDGALEAALKAASIKNEVMGVQDADTLLENPSLSDKGMLQLNGLEDCDLGDGKEISLRFDGMFSPPSTWESADGELITADTPPPDTSYTAGQVWYANIGIGFYGQSFDALMADIVDRSAINFTYECTNGGGGFILGPARQGGFVFLTFTAKAIGDLALGGSIIGFDPALHSNRYEQVSCIGATGQKAVVCAIVEAPDAMWPSSDHYQLARNSSGQFVSHPSDPNVATKYTTPRSSLSLCTTGGKNVDIVPTSDGGFAFYETSSGAPTGIIQLYNADGTKKGYTDTAGLAGYLPSPDYAYGIQADIGEAFS